MLTGVNECRFCSRASVLFVPTLVLPFLIPPPPSPFPSVSLSPDPSILLYLHLSCRGNNSVLLAVCLCVLYSRCAHSIPICHHCPLLLVTRLFTACAFTQGSGSITLTLGSVATHTAGKRAWRGKPCVVVVVLSCERDGLLSVFSSPTVLTSQLTLCRPSHLNRHTGLRLQRRP